ncbi:MAG: sugar ABC transporter substrate-binding protein [Burkholderiales bacterium]|nr:sugar ABC transporter substrate-binding protein [Burkholderiales bacterium]
MTGGNEPKLAVFTKNRTNPAYAAARLGADRTAARLGASTRHFVPERPDDFDQQIALIDEALGEHPDAFVFVPVHDTAVDAAVARIEAAGIPIFNIINRLQRTRPVSFVGSDDRVLAIAVAERLFAHLGHRGNVAIMEGTPGSVTSQARLAGFREAAARHAGIRVVVEGAGDYQEATARRLMAQWLAAGRALDAVLCANDVMALGAIDAMRSAQRAIPLTGVNALPAAITAIREGRLLASADFDAMNMGCVATEAAIRHLRGEQVPAEIMLPVQVVDAANCALWDRPIEARTCPRWEDVVAAR